MEDAGYHFDSAEGKAVWGHGIVTTHYVNGDIEYPVRLSLYVKKETCLKNARAFKTKIQLACEQIEAFMPPAGTNTVVTFFSITTFHLPSLSKSRKKMSFGFFITEKARSAASRKPDMLNFRVLLCFVSLSLHSKV